MNIEPKAGPNILNPPGANTSAPQQSARERAIAKIMTTPEQMPVSNPTNVSPEEMSAIRPPSNTAEPKAEPSEAGGQQDINSAADKQEPKAATKEPALSSQYAQLARKEKALRLQAQDLKRQQMEFKAQQDAIAAAKAQAQAPSTDLSKYIQKDRLAEDPWGVLQEAGMTPDKLTELMMKAPAPHDVALQHLQAEVRAELKALKDAQEQTKKTYENQQKSAYDQAVSQIRNEAKNLVKENPVEYEAIMATGSVGDIVELIEKTFHKDGIMLTVEEAARETEEYLSEQALRLSKLNKIQQKLRQASPASAKPQQQAAVTSDKQPQGMKTLTNSVSTGRKMSARERALLAFEGKLNK